LPRLTGLWLNADFRRFWIADTISTFGTLVTRVALPFTAILALDASAFEVALIGIAEMVPALLVGLPVGAWVDRLHRRPILIAADIGRALVLVTIPIAAVFDALTLWQIYVVSLLTSVMSMFFEVAYLSYLPSLVKKDDLLDANSKIAGSQSVVEFSAFGASGWLVQLFSGPGAILIDSISFIFSALFLRRIKEPEQPVEHEETLSMRESVGEGLRFVARNAILRSVAVSSFCFYFGTRMFGVVISLYALNELDFNPGVLGIIFGIGGIASFVGAASVGRVNARFGVGPSMGAGLLMYAAGMVLLPLSPEASLAAGLILVTQQFGDGFAMVYIINEVSLRQAIANPQVIGRVNGLMRVIETSAMLSGVILGGLIGEFVGLRETLATGAMILVVGAILLLLSPVRGVRHTPVAETVQLGAPAD
jgi:predicted MFS family arabinose efflux permease